MKFPYKHRLKVEKIYFQEGEKMRIKESEKGNRAVKTEKKKRGKTNWANVPEEERREKMREIADKLLTRRIPSMRGLILSLIRIAQTPEEIHGVELVITDLNAEIADIMTEFTKRYNAKKSGKSEDKKEKISVGSKYF